MRKCIRCGADMLEDKPVRASDSAVGLIVADSNRLFAGSIGRLRAAVCPECGEVSLYISMDEIEKYKNKKQG